jgi:hypothetical protein
VAAYDKREVRSGGGWTMMDEGGRRGQKIIWLAGR